MKTVQCAILLSALTMATLAQPSFAARVETRDIYSEAMKKDIPATFVTPDSYSKGTESYPVVYLLHGYSGDHGQWLEFSPLEDLADRHDVIIACPDGGYGSWYFDSPEDPAYRYETHVAAEVVAFTDEKYRTIKSREGRAITGLSMGGHGGMFLALRHKDVFGAAGSTSGGVDIRPFPDNWEIKDRLGALKDHPDRWETLTVINNVSLIENNELAIIIDCGVDDFFMDVNRVLHKKLLEAGIDHDYIERPGGHDHEYWRNSIKYQILFFDEFFKKTRD
jgi:S-formylglutathione hydrolase FrmB